MKHLLLDIFGGRLGNWLFQIASLTSLGACRFPQDDYTRLKQQFPNLPDNDAPWDEHQHQNSEQFYEPPTGNADVEGLQGMVQHNNVRIRDCYLQSWKYFSDRREVLCKYFTFSDSIVAANKKWYRLFIGSKPSVCIHVRRTDYLREPRYFQFTEDYVLNCVKYFQRIDPRFTFVFISDDIEWCKRISVPAPTLYYSSSNRTCYDDLHMLTLFNNYVLSASTFAWWGCYLSEHYHTQHVIGPPFWWNKPYIDDDVYLPHWHRGPMDQGFHLDISTYPIWSRGWGDLMIRDNPGFPTAYFADLHTEDLLDVNSMQEHFVDLKGYVWLRMGSKRYGESDIATFAWKILPTLQSPIKLITSDGDLSIPCELPSGVKDTILNSPNILSWHTQNFDGTSHPKLHPLPIGLDLHTMKQPLAQVCALQNLPLVPWKERKNRVLVDVRNKSHSERYYVEQVLQGIPHIDFHRTKVPFAEAMSLYSSFKFMVSPRGNGLDTHRLWELLCLKTVPIVRKGPLDSLLKGLPVIIVEDWTDVTDPNKLAQWEEEITPLVEKFDPVAQLQSMNWLLRANKSVEL